MIAKKNEQLFYAAFELRAGIESRMQQYLEPYDHISKKEKREWKLGNLSRACKKYFYLHSQIQKVEIMTEKNEHVAAVYYTPVTAELINLGERLGKYLHAMKTFEKDSSLWWSNFRELLEECYRWLDFACRGTLLGAIVRGQNDGSIFNLEEPADDIRKVLSAGAKIQMKFQYYDINDTTLP